MLTTLLGILCIAAGIYVCMNSGRSISSIYKECNANKELYLSALKELSNRIEHLINNIPDEEMQQIRFMKLSDVILNKQAKAILVLKLYSLSDAVNRDAKEMKKKIFFGYYPIKLFYYKYGKVIEDIPQLKEEIKEDGN